MKIRLTHKFSNFINGIDLSKAHEGDTLDLSTRDANMLLAEGWAAPAGFEGKAPPQDIAPDRAQRRRTPPRSSKKR